MTRVITSTILRTMAAACLVGTLVSCGDDGKQDDHVIRVGHFPNITHVQSLVARNMERHGKGWFEERVPGYKFEWFTYNAGPSAMEAIFARSIDMTYVGPSPAINAYAKSKGREVRIVSGAANGASALVARKDSGIHGAADMLGKTIATPQLGNTQDVACRAWLAGQGYKVILRGALAPDSLKKEKDFTTSSNGVDVNIIPTANPDQLALFQSGQLDAVWTVEPWITRLEREAGAVPVLEEKDAVTTVLVARTEWMKKHPELLRKVVRAHEELTDWIIQHPEEAQKMVVEELSALTKTQVSPELIQGAWKRLVLTNEISVPGLEKFIHDAQVADLLDEVPPVQGMVASPLAQ
ncbi:ABC transporter substrate-binding protein [Akkermansia sp. N21116]|uniref:ABC transporter substrate-binding protein n=1 Tax=Akkermansia sp. N21116 TaxID=3040764 RepID=UPI002AC99BDC|nr:ABC transporter substrate-binding protein [Akkermansia sp. N21116]WPX39768.1 ABC transporter substrate-binding protein [Akkermansia sp. N21116]